MGGGQDAPGKIAPDRHKVQCLGIRRLQGLQIAVNFQQVLMLKGFIDRKIIISPAEMGRGTGFDAGSRRARHSRYADFAVQQTGGSQRQKRQLDGRGEATRIGNEVGPGDAAALPLGQAVHIALALVPEILGQIDDLQSGRTRMLRPESAAFPMTGAEEYHIGRRQIRFFTENQVCFPEQAGMHGPYRIPGVTGTLGKDDLHLRMVDQQANQFTGRIAGRTDDSDPDHRAFSISLPSSVWLA